MPAPTAKPGLWLCGLAGIASPLLCTLVSWPLREELGSAGILLVYLLGVFLVATRFGRYPSMLAWLLSAAGFAYFFARPIFSLAISDTQNMVGLAVMLVVALVSGGLMEKAREQARLAAQGERRATALYSLSRDLARARQEDEIARIAVRHIQAVFGIRNALLLADAGGRLARPAGKPLAESLTGINRAAAQRAFDCAWRARLGLDKGMARKAGYFPLVGAETALGILVMEAESRPAELPEGQDALLEAFINQIVQAIERARAAEQAKNAFAQAEAESLRNSLLSAISHDLRTPLTAIIGASSTLVKKAGTLPPENRIELHGVIQEEAMRMSDLIHKILDMARLSAGKMALNRQWNDLEEIIGSALNRLEQALKDRPVKIRLPGAMPLVFVDAVLLQQILLNLLENALKYTPESTAIEISAEASSFEIVLSVADSGPGVPRGLESQVFEKFYRLQPESAQSGAGLGLAICRAVVEAHGGEITVANRPEGGAVFMLRLPLPCQPPPIEAGEALEFEA